MDIHCDRIAVFSGTSEGYELALHMKKNGGLELTDFYVATGYGVSTFDDLPQANVVVGRLTCKEMEKLFAGGKYGMVIDATHPYADAVTANLKSACEKTGTKYIRLLREESKMPGNVILTKNIEEAVRMLNEMQGGFLLTTGAKEISKFAHVTGFPDRAVARVLPSVDSLDACMKAGVRTRNIICMQGPFTREMNLATMKQYDLDILVTKSTGKAGGFSEKTSIADEGYKVIVVGRPPQEEGMTLEEAIGVVSSKFGSV